MLNNGKPSREEQVAFMVNAAERTDAHAQEWLSDPEFKAGLHRYDNKNNEDHRSVKRAMG